MVDTIFKGCSKIVTLASLIKTIITPAFEKNMFHIANLLIFTTSCVQVCLLDIVVHIKR